MNKIIFISIFIATSFLTSLNAQNISKTSLCKTWYLHHYKYVWLDYDPEEKEKNDYIQFNKNMSYVSVDEGEKSTGKWELNAKAKFILMYDEKGKNIKLKIKKVNNSEFVFTIDIKELKGIEIYYTDKKR
jgi:hypothetical protein